MIFSTKLVEIKFLSLCLPKKLSIYKIIHMTSPSICYLIRPYKCLRYLSFGNVKNSAVASRHCGHLDHDVESCEVYLKTSSRYIHYKLDHLASNRAFLEFTIQKYIKRIMAVQNKFYAEAI